MRRPSGLRIDAQDLSNSFDDELLFTMASISIQLILASNLQLEVTLLGQNLRLFWTGTTKKIRGEM